MNKSYTTIFLSMAIFIETQNIHKTWLEKAADTEPKMEMRSSVDSHQKVKKLSNSIKINYDL